jgi:ATP-dependent RNA helicase RhlE
LIDTSSEDPGLPAEPLRAEIAHPVDQDRKRELLAHLAKLGQWRQVLVFCRTKHGANRLVEQLERDGIPAAAIHGNKTPPQRMKALASFKNDELQVLVVTDIGALDLDVESLPRVVNYDLPPVPEDYVRRIGLRAGGSGQAVSLVSGEDRGPLRAVERLTGRTIAQQVVPGFEPGPGYESAQTEPEPRRGRPQPGVQTNPRRRPDRSRGAPRGPQRPQAPARARQGNGQRRDPRREREPRAVAHSDREQDAVRQEQLEYHRQQLEAERRAESEPAREQKNEQDPALFGLVGRK